MCLDEDSGHRTLHRDTEMVLWSYMCCVIMVYTDLMGILSEEEINHILSFLLTSCLPNSKNMEKMLLSADVRVNDNA